MTQTGGNAKSDLDESIIAQLIECGLQRPYNDWHSFIDDPIIADAVLDRLSSNRFHIKLKGQSRRKKEANLDDLKD